MINKSIKDKILGVNKVVVIIALLLIAGAILAIGGIVEVKDGQLNVTDSMLVDTNTLYVDSANDKVGIGTTNPGKELEVAGRINGTELNISGNANLAYGSGNVGIRTSTPTMPLHVVGNANITGNLTVGGFGAKIAQIVFDTNNTVATYSTGFPDDDTIPQRSEGDEILSVNITPQNADSTILIFSSVNLRNSVTLRGHALFISSSNDALMAEQARVNGGQQSLMYIESAGSTNARTYSIRIGDSTGNNIVTNDNPASKWGAKEGSYMVIAEILP